MIYYSFEHIKEMIYKWSQDDMLMQFSENDSVDVIKNNKKVLLLELTFNYCIVQILVNKPSFAPYQYVSFEAMTFDSIKAQETGQMEMIYSFYDSAGMEDQEVLVELKVGIKRCSEYKPDQLKEGYPSKKRL